MFTYPQERWQTFSMYFLGTYHEGGTVMVFLKEQVNKIKATVLLGSHLLKNMVVIISALYSQPFPN